MPESDSDRRPLATRGAAWVQSLAAALARARVAPNAISVASVVAAALGTWALASVPGIGDGKLRAGLYVAAAAAIQLRLLCNLLDGLVAVEGGLRTKTGEVFNDFPDRVADVLLIVGAGYAARETHYGIELGWLAAALALITAYVRVLGKSVGAGMHFLGPMAKQHRMALLTLACLVAAVMAQRAEHTRVLPWALAVMSAGSVVTIVRRLRLVLVRLNAS